MQCRHTYLARQEPVSQYDFDGLPIRDMHDSFFTFYLFIKYFQQQQQQLPMWVSSLRSVSDLHSQGRDLKGRGLSEWSHECLTLIRGDDSTYCIPKHLRTIKSEVSKVGETSKSRLNFESIQPKKNKKSYPQAKRAREPLLENKLTHIA